MNDSNLIPNKERSPSELREMGRKGGIKSGEIRRRKKKQREYVGLLTKALGESAEFKKLVEFVKNTLQ